VPILLNIFGALVRIGFTSWDSGSISDIEETGVDLWSIFRLFEVIQQSSADSLPPVVERDEAIAQLEGAEPLAPRSGFRRLRRPSRLAFF